MLRAGARAQAYAHDQMEHGMMGIGFHRQQSRAVPAFCTEARVAEVQQAVHVYEAGDFGVKP